MNYKTAISCTVLCYDEGADTFTVQLRDAAGNAIGEQTGIDAGEFATHFNHFDEPFAFIDNEFVNDWSEHLKHPHPGDGMNASYRPARADAVDPLTFNFKP